MRRRATALAAALTLALVGAATAQDRAASLALDAGVPGAADAGAIDAGPPSPRAAALVTIGLEIEKLELRRLRLASADPAEWQLDVAVDLAGVDLRDPRAVDARVGILRQRLAAARALADDRREIAQRLESDAQRPRQSRRRQPAAPAQDPGLLEVARAEATLAETRAALQQALIDYLVSTQPARREAHASAAEIFERERLELVAEQRAAIRAEAAAAGESERAANLAERALAEAKGRLVRVRAAQLAFRQQLLSDQKTLALLEQDAATARLALMDAIARLDAPRSSAADPLFNEVSRELDDVASEALAHGWKLLLGAHSTPWRPRDQLPEAVLELPPDYHDRVDALRATRRELERQADELAQTRRRVDRELGAARASRTRELLGWRSKLFERISSELEEELLALGEVSRQAASVELEQALGRALIHLARRRYELTHAPRASVRSGLQIAIGSVELLLFIALVVWAMRRWQSWMRRLVAAMGSYVHLGPWPIFVARTADALQTCGPPFLLAVASAVVYYFIGPRQAPIELTLLFPLVFWLALYRGQMRFVQRLADNWIARAESRRSLEEAVGESHDHGDHDPADPLRIITIDPDQQASPSPQEEAGAVFKRSWRLVTAYLTVIVIALDLTELTLGRGVVYQTISILAFALAIPMAIVVVHWWRKVIVATYTRHLGGTSAFARLLSHHGGRRYGALIAVLALPALFLSRGSALLRSRVANLDASRRVLAFLFRRQVEKHAERVGQDHESTPELPDPLLAMFPVSPLEAREAPLRPACIDDLEAMISAWAASPADGSAALIGDRGMGKSTALSFLSAELEREVHVVRIDSKVTHPASLYDLVRERLDIVAEGGPDALAAELRQRFRGQVIALDDCHDLYLRRVGGFQAWHALLRLIDETSRDVFWVLSLSYTAWTYLVSIGGGTSRVRRVFSLPGLSEDSLRQLMMKRMRRARYRTSFSDLLVSYHEGMKRSTQIIRTSRGYFSLLWDYTQGNPLIASHFWLRSLAVEGDEARVRLFSTPPVEALDALPDDAAFALAALFEHDNLNVSELTSITNTSRDDSRFVLQLCRDMGMLDAGSDGRYWISTHWHMAIKRYLKRKNLLHG